MATLQKTLTHADLDSVVPGVRLVFDIPVFRYTELHLTETDNKSAKTVIHREIVDRYKKEHLIEGREYLVDVSECETTRDGNPALRRQYLASQFAGGEIIGSINLEDVSFTVTVEITHDGADLGRQELEIIDVAGIGNRVQQEIFFVNKRAYERLVDRMNMGAFSATLLLAVFSSIRSQRGGVTIIQKEFSAVVERVLRTEYSRIAEPERSTLLAALPALLKRIEKFDLGSLLDFPIAVPRLRFDSLGIGGGFTVETDSPERVTASTLGYYALTLEYSNGREARIVRVPWDNSGAFRGNEPLPFSVELRDAISGPLLLTVKALGGSIVWQRQLDSTEDGLGDISIRVPLLQPSTLGASPSGPGGHARKVRGRLIQAGGQERSLKGLTVLIQAKREGDEFWRIVSAAESDRSGNFSMVYPFGSYSEAQALVSVSPDSPIPLQMTDRANESIPDDFLFLLLGGDSASAAATTEDCDCHAPQQVKRLPDQEDLINSDEYTQDVGGACVNLSTPNRTLREYTHQAIVRISDPDVANYTLEKITDFSGNILYRLNRGRRTFVRKSVDVDNPIRWQDAPDASQNLTLYQAVSVATGHILHYKSIFKADGYSMGELLYSLPLAPGQKKQVVVFDSAHTLSGAESQTMSQGESLSASLVNDRSITDQLSGTLGEAMDGSSNAHTSGMSAGLGAAGSMGPIGGSLGVSGGFADASSSASQNSSRNISQFFGERLRQSIMQNAESYRRLNATVVTTVREGQQYAVTTESIANHNHCHAVTMMYFEVLRHYAIYQELAHVEECVFVPLLMTHFTTENISKWRDVLSRFLLPMPSNTYLQQFNALTKLRQHPLLKAFDANERIKTDYAHVDYPEEHERYADEPMTSVQGTLTLRINLRRPKMRYDRIKSLPMVTQTVSRQELDVDATVKKNALLAGVPLGFLGMGPETRTVTEENIVVGKIFDQFMQLDHNYATVAPARCIRVVSFLPRPITQADGTIVNASDEFFDGGDNDKRLWSAYAALLPGYSGENGVYEMLQYYFAGKLISEWDDIFYNDIAPEVFNSILNSIHFDRINFDVTALDDYNGGERSIRVRLRAGSIGISRSALPAEIAISTSDPVRALNGGSVLMRVEKVQINYTTDHFEGALYNGFVGDDLYDGVVLPIPLNAADKRNPRKEDRFVVKQLIEHLNSQIEHYNKILWYNLDPDRRFMLLDGFHIQVFNGQGDPVEHRSLASVVKNQLVTITGNSMVFPVAAGYRVSQSYILEDETATAALFDHYQPLTPVPPYRISVPTRGVFLEAVQSACDSCEKVKPNSSQDWNKFGIDEPTAISPVTTPVPTVTDWRAAFKDFAQPLVNIQNAPATPEPGAGLAGLSELLGKAGVFNDITGLQGNQQNAIRTYLSNQENVRAMAEMAKGLAMQQHNTANSQSITDSIAQARETGAIDEGEASSLMRQHLQQQIDGGESVREQARTERERERPSLVGSAVDAVQDGRTVRAERTDADGNVESVVIGGREPSLTGAAINVEYDVEPRQQPDSPANACWATAATMMMDWKNQSSSSIEEVLRRAGSRLSPPDEERYIAIYGAGTGMLGSQKEQFVAALGMVGEAPANYPLSQYVSWMRAYGPLWITIDAAGADDQFSPHARILTSIRSLGGERDEVMFAFNDPVTGRPDTQSFDNFTTSFEQMARDAGGALRMQVVHFREEIEIGEGGYTSVITSDMTSNWGYLVRHVNAQPLPSGYANQLINAAGSDGTNLDLYQEVIVQLPTIAGVTQTPETFFEYFRLHLNDFVRLGGHTSTFTPVFPPPTGTWPTPAPLGALIDILIYASTTVGATDNGYVVCSHFQPGRRWIFSTVTGPLFSSGTHPVSGNREFGIYQEAESGHLVLYTKGADRSYIGPLAESAFDGGHQMWLAVQRGLRIFINSNSGSAYSRPPVRHPVYWVNLDRALAPTIPLP